jgi:hypothetical protein
MGVSPTLHFAALAAIVCLLAPFAHPQAPKPQKNIKRAHVDTEWIWQYSPDDQHQEGRENDLVQDLKFSPMLQDNFTAPQSFWGVQGTKFKPIADTILDFLTVPGKVLADETRYITITGNVVHFAPARGLLFVDLNPAPKNSTGPDHLMLFAAIQWTQGNRPATDPNAEYTLWVFPNQTLAVPEGTAPSQIPNAFKRSIARWAFQPLAGSGIVQHITKAVLVDPDGTQHPVAPTALGLIKPEPQTDSAPLLKPRN